MLAPDSGLRWSRQETSRTSVSVRGCLAVAARRETVEAGLAVMIEGGNAVDAAVAMAFTAAVCEPTEASIGGSGFMLVHDTPNGGSWSVEFPPRAPLRARPDMYRLAGGVTDERLLGTVPVRDDANATGVLAPCVPGVVAGLCLARERLGSMPLPRLMEPAIELAEAGFEIDEYLTLQSIANLDALRANPETERTFLVRGLPPVAPFATRGAAPRLRQPDLAQTLRAIAAGGADSFYRGSVAEAIGAAFADHGGLLSRADLAAYQASLEPPLQRSYRGRSVLAPRAPSGAWTVLEALRIIDRLPAAQLAGDPLAGLHALAQALQVAFAERHRSGGDPHHGAVGHGTTHLNAIDAEGRLVSCTLTAGHTFGSKFVANGILFDSGMAWFDARPGKANSIAPGKRPLVNMAPLLLLEDGEPRLALGAAGGRRIISAVLQVLTAVVDRGLDVQAAVSAPRLDASERTVRVSDRLPPATREGLAALGHDVLTVSEQHAPFSFEFARPAAAAIDESGLRSGGIHPFARGYVAGC